MNLFKILKIVTDSGKGLLKSVNDNCLEFRNRTLTVVYYIDTHRVFIPDFATSIDTKGKDEQEISKIIIEALDFTVTNGKMERFILTPGNWDNTRNGEIQFPGLELKKYNPVKYEGGFDPYKIEMLNGLEIKTNTFTTPDGTVLQYKYIENKMLGDKYYTRQYYGKDIYNFSNAENITHVSTPSKNYFLFKLS